MFQKKEEQGQIGSRILDVLICFIAFYGAFWLRTHPAFTDPTIIGTLESVQWVLGLSLFVHLFLYPRIGLYDPIRTRSLGQLIHLVLKATLLEALLIGTFVFLLQEKATSRIFFGLFISLNFVLVLGGRLLLRAFAAKFRRRSFHFRQVLVVGTGMNAERMIGVIRKNPQWGMIPTGILAESYEKKQTLKECFGVPVIGTLEDLPEVISERTVDEVYFAQDKIQLSEMADYVGLCQKFGIPTRFSMAVFELPNSKASFSEMDGMPVLTYYTSLMSPIEAALKRTMDILISLIGLCIAALFYPWIAYRIRKESPGPIIFKQMRVGENGRRFKCYKFRTMTADAELKKLSLMKKNQMQGPLFKIDKDPRVTPFGRFLRKSSLDELPQFFNILRGDMSVVGTRPPTPDEVKKYEPHYRRRLSIRPGLTGLWQVSGRNKIHRFEDVLDLDLQYIDRWSIGLDLKIILKTVWVTVFRRGAY